MKALLVLAGGGAAAICGIFALLVRSANEYGRTLDAIGAPLWDNPFTPQFHGSAWTASDPENSGKPRAEAD